MRGNSNDAKLNSQKVLQFYLCVYSLKNNLSTTFISKAVYKLRRCEGPDDSRILF